MFDNNSSQKYNYIITNIMLKRVRSHNLRFSVTLVTLFVFFSVIQLIVVLK